MRESHITQYFAIDFPDPTLYLVVNSGFSFLCLLIFFWLLMHNPWRLLRPAFLLALLVHVIYQWPLALISGTIEKSLRDPWWFSLTIHLFVFSLICWTWLLRKLDVRAETYLRPHLGRLEIYVPVLFAVALTCIYLFQIPWNCTGLYALLFDPHMTLLAREFSMKFVASWSVRAYGTLVNVAVPVVCAVSLVSICNNIKQKKSQQH